MKCAQDRCAVVVAREIRPRWYGRIHGSGSLEEDAASEGESQVPYNGGYALELGIPIIQQERPERTPIIRRSLVRSYKPVNRVRIRVVEEDVLEVR